MLPRNVRQNQRHRGRHGCAAARCSGGWPNLSRNGYDHILLIFVTMTLLAGFSPNSTPPFKQIRNAGNSKNQERGGTPQIKNAGELHEYLAEVPSLALAEGKVAEVPSHVREPEVAQG